jgi:2-desacetyl-2-hydroxyethyl bacteriochlorophyllide A dehydrogenase
MRAVVQGRYGLVADEVLRVAEVPAPKPGRRDILVRVAAASVDRGTWHLMAGRPRLMRLLGFGFRRPKAGNPGRSFAGTAIAVGTDVTSVSIGDEVYGTGDGSFAELVSADQGHVARKPANLSFEQAAAVPVSAMAAIQAVREAGVQPGQRVLIIGASGGVGSSILQLVKDAGAHATAVASAAKADLARSLGADEVIDYTREDYTDGRRVYDVILDTGGDRSVSALRRSLAPGGTLVIVGGETDGRWIGGFARSLRVMLLAPFVRSQRLRALTSEEQASDLDALRKLIEACRLTPVIDRIRPLEEVPAAIADLVEGRAQGKTVIAVSA